MKYIKSNKGWLRVLAVIVAFIFVVGLFEALGMLLAGVDLEDRESYLHMTSVQELTVSLFTLIGSFLVLALFMKYVDKEKFINIGLHTKNRLKDFTFGLGLGLFIMGVGFLVLFLLDEIHFQKIFFDIKELLFSIIRFSIVAIIEEALFRGYILKNLMLSFHKYVALIVSSALFALAHAANPNISWFSLFDLFLGGILLGVSYLYTKNLWFPIALHFSWNFFQTLLGFNVSGQDSYSLIEITITKENILNGGKFGFEGSILSTIAQVFFIFVVYLYFKRKFPLSNT